MEKSEVASLPKQLEKNARSHRHKKLTLMTAFILLILAANLMTFLKSEDSWKSMFVLSNASNPMMAKTTPPTTTSLSYASYLSTHALNEISTNKTFNVLVQTAFELLKNDPIGKLPRLTSLPRNDFHLETWTKGTGGLTDNDRVLLASIYANASSVFEFGLGESTKIASHVGVPRYSGIDSDAVWVSQSRDAVQSHFRFYLADIGKTGEWGNPRIPTLSKSVLDYQLAPLLVEPEAFDVYMVDGRMRLACMMASFLHASFHEAPTNHTLVLLHDCSATAELQKKLNMGTRMVYRAADHLLDLVMHSGDKLCVYRRKSSTSDEELLHVWQKYLRNWS